MSQAAEDVAAPDEGFDGLPDVSGVLPKVNITGIDFGAYVTPPLWGSVLLLLAAIGAILAFGPPQTRQYLLKVVSVKPAKRKDGNKEAKGSVYRLLAVLDPADVGGKQYIKLLLTALLSAYMQCFIPLNLVRTLTNRNVLVGARLSSAWAKKETWVGLFFVLPPVLNVASLFIRQMTDALQDEVACCFKLLSSGKPPRAQTEEVVVSKAVDEEMGLVFEENFPANRCLILASVDEDCPGEEFGCDRFCGWQLSHVSGEPVHSSDSFSEQSLDKDVCILRFVIPKVVRGFTHLPDKDAPEGSPEPRMWKVGDSAERPNKLGVFTRVEVAAVDEEKQKVRVKDLRGKTSDWLDLLSIRPLTTTMDPVGLMRKKAEKAAKEAKEEAEQQAQQAADAAADAVMDEAAGTGLPASAGLAAVPEIQRPATGLAGGLPAPASTQGMEAPPGAGSHEMAGPAPAVHPLGPAAQSATARPAAGLLPAGTQPAALPPAQVAAPSAGLPPTQLTPSAGLPPTQHTPLPAGLPPAGVQPPPPGLQPPPPAGLPPPSLVERSAGPLPPPQPPPQPPPTEPRPVRPPPPPPGGLLPAAAAGPMQHPTGAAVPRTVAAPGSFSPLQEAQLNPSGVEPYVEHSMPVPPSAEAFTPAGPAADAQRKRRRPQRLPDAGVKGKKSRAQRLGEEQQKAAEELESARAAALHSAATCLVAAAAAAVSAAVEPAAEESESAGADSIPFGTFTEPVPELQQRSRRVGGGAVMLGRVAAQPASDLTQLTLRVPVPDASPGGSPLRTTRRRGAMLKRTMPKTYKIASKYDGRTIGTGNMQGGMAGARQRLQEGMGRARDKAREAHEQVKEFVDEIREQFDERMEQLQSGGFRYPQWLQPHIELVFCCIGMLLTFFTCFMLTLVLILTVCTYDADVTELLTKMIALYFVEELPRKIMDTNPLLRDLYQNEVSAQTEREDAARMAKLLLLRTAVPVIVEGVMKLLYIFGVVLIVLSVWVKADSQEPVGVMVL